MKNIPISLTPVYRNAKLKLDRFALRIIRAEAVNEIPCLGIVKIAKVYKQWFDGLNSDLKKVLIKHPSNLAIQKALERHKSKIVDYYGNNDV